MKQKYFVAVILALCGFPGSVWSTPRTAGDVGAGVILGSPFGFSAKWWLSRDQAIAGALGVADSDLEITGDYLWHTERLFPKPRQGNLPLFLGIGGRAHFEDDPEVGIRFVVGAEYLFDQVPLGIFVELVPVLNVAPDVDSDFSGGIGVRYYFGSRLRRR